MNTERLPLILLGAGFAAVLAGAFYLLFLSPSPSAISGAVEPIKSTLGKSAPSQPDSLPFANSDEQPSRLASPPPPPEPQAVAGTAPGNFIHYGGKLISVAETIPSEDGSGNALAVDIVADPAASSATAKEEVTASGLTAEEELFRAKWGWAATDDIKTAAANPEAATGR